MIMQNRIMTRFQIQRENVCKSTPHLLAATLAFYIDRSFRKTCTMKEVREHFIVRTKQLSLCITGRKYLDGSERTPQLKCKKKSVPAETTRRDPDDDDNGDPPPAPEKEGISAVKEQPN